MGALAAQDSFNDTPQDDSADSGDSTTDDVQNASDTVDYFAPHWGAAFQGVNSAANKGQWAPAARPENSSAIFYMTDPGE
jgi:hypothetical protein